MSEETYVPPYRLTDKIIHMVAEINELIGVAIVKNGELLSPVLRRENQIRSIHSSLAIENNTLSLDQVTDIINGKRIVGPPDEVKEIKNAYDVYNILLSFDPYSIDDLLTAHKILMTDLSKEAGQFRCGGVGIFAEKKLINMVSPANIVPKNIMRLIDWVKVSKAHPLIKSCVFHYEFVFMHPFDDGNGRMGRMWQTILLAKWRPLFAWLPIEELICERRQEYYDVLGGFERADSTVFIEYMLEIIRDSLIKMHQTEQVREKVREQVTEQVEQLLNVLKNETFSADEIIERLNIKHKPTFFVSYLRPALKLGLVEMTIPDKPNSNNQKYRIVTR